MFPKSPEKAAIAARKLSASPRANYVLGEALSKLAEARRSNALLEQAVTTFQKLTEMPGVPQALVLKAANRTVENLRFLGQMGRAVQLQTKLVARLPYVLSLQNQLAVSYLMMGQGKRAKTILKQVLKERPEDGFALVHLGFILKTEDQEYKEAISLLQKGLATREPGVVDGRFYFHLGDALARTGHNSQAMEVYQEGVEQGVFNSVYQRSLYNVQGLKAQPWWDPMTTTYRESFRILESRWKEIRDEALALLSQDQSRFRPETEGLQDTGDWKQLELFARGMKLTKNCQKAPKTCTLIEFMPDAARCKRGQVKFSLMNPGTHVWAHTGPTNCRLRAHLGLVVPPGEEIALRVANTTRHWQEGKVLLFDDSFEHEVWHHGPSMRLVLIVDFWHPELTAAQKRTLSPI
ncbi:hypothetical protein LAZ67_23001615 [Cordylochernes scorpioides]|uniref:Aspartyl/asparaginy/proline hydroxylase domain-containing protein n=1 Tax=Cordylochernes scorpioides TaxID=51811 RepID=A0ABY6LQU3_9ARAC|nr:hypothetical protein LAZ67_23001615 [Cordylochernes scorpioides]